MEEQPEWTTHTVEMMISDVFLRSYLLRAIIQNRNDSHLHLKGFSSEVHLNGWLFALANRECDRIGGGLGVRAHPPSIYVFLAFYRRNFYGAERRL